MTDKEKQDIIDAVLLQIQNNSQSVDTLQLADSLNGVSSLPCVKGDELVSVPLSLFEKIVSDTAASSASGAIIEETNARISADANLQAKITETKDGNAELLKRIIGKSTFSSSYSDPFKYLTDYQSEKDANGTITKHAIRVMQDALLDTLRHSDYRDSFPYIGHMRAHIEGVPIEMWTYVKSWNTGSTNGVFVQVVRTNFGLKNGVISSALTEAFHEYFRTVTVGMANGSVTDVTATAWNERTAEISEKADEGISKADAALDQIFKERKERAAADADLEELISEEEAARDTAVSNERAARTAADSELQAKLTGIEESLYGKGQCDDPEKSYFTIQLDNTSPLDIRSVWDNTNIKNETSGSCTIDFGDGGGPVSIVERESMYKNNVPAGTYIISITGITSVVGNTMFRESSLLIGAKLTSTLKSVTGWLFNGAPNLSEVTFMGTTPPIFSGNGISASSLNLVSVINVPESAISAYQSSTMSDALKAKLEAIDEGIVANIANIEKNVANLQSGLAGTNESVKELADYVDSKFPEPIDKTKTYFTIEVSAGNIDLRTIYYSTNIKNETAGTCTIDYGDGTPIVPISSENDLFHNYAQNGTYTLAVTGLTGLTSNLLFRESKILKDAKFGNTFVNPSTYYMLNGVAMESVTFFATTPLTWYKNTVGATLNLVSKIIVPKDSLLSYIKAWYFNTSTNKDWLTKKIVPDEPVDYYYNPVTVTVGQSGDFTSLNDAIQSLSTSYPIYKYGGLKAVIKILSGTTIAEQVYIDGFDLSWITIEYEDYNPSLFNYDSVAESIANGTIVFDTTEGYNSVAVDASSWTSAGITHDTRGDVCLFRAENGGRLPIINCVFKLTTPNSSYPACGCLCNRGSEAIIKTLCGFIGFQDGVISNNESSITIREGITMNCSRWGCHARHNGEVSARSVIATGCATNVAYASEYGAAVADRVADMDVREAYLGGNYAIRCHNASSICARATHVICGGVENAYIVQATYSGRINASGMTFTGTTEGSKMYEVLYAGWIDTFGVTGKTYNVSTLNTIDGFNGIIFG